MPEPIIKPPPKLQYDVEGLKPMLGKNVQILLDSPRPWSVSWVVGKIIAIENTSVVILPYGQRSIDIPTSAIAAMIRLADY